MTWAGQRKLIYIGGIVLVFLLVVVLPTILHFYKAPTCFDKKQNGSELGVDCGGSCVLLCPAQYVSLNILWSRFAKVNDGIYNVLAYIENPNLEAEINSLDYVFRLYDKKGILLKERFGKTYVPANKIMAVFEPGLLTGNQILARVDFNIITKAVWAKPLKTEASLSVSNTEMLRLDSAPRLNFNLANNGVLEVKNIEVIGIVYNSANNTIAFSRTVVDSLIGKEQKTISLNWPKPFSDTSARTEIILKVLK